MKQFNHDYDAMITSQSNVIIIKRVIEEFLIEYGRNFKWLLRKSLENLL